MLCQGFQMEAHRHNLFMLTKVTRLENFGIPGFCTYLFSCCGVDSYAPVSILVLQYQYLMQECHGAPRFSVKFILA